MSRTKERNNLLIRECLHALACGENIKGVSNKFQIPLATTQNLLIRRRRKYGFTSLYQMVAAYAVVIFGKEVSCVKSAKKRVNLDTLLQVTENKDTKALASCMDNMILFSQDEIMTTKKNKDINIRISSEHHTEISKAIKNGEMSEIIRAALLLYARSGYFRKHVDELRRAIKLS